MIGAWWEELQAQKLFEGSKPAVSELDQQLFADGLRHEQVLLTKLEKAGHSIARLPGKQTDAHYAATREAMAEGVEFIHQASLCNQEMRGSTDLLKRIDRPSLLGEWSYIPIECKLASKPKTTFLVQALAYCELLTPHLGKTPEHFELYLGGGKFKEFRTKDFWAWYRQLRNRYAEFLESFDPRAIPEDERGDHGSWSAFIDERLVDQRDLILVADMRESQRKKLRAAGITSIDQLANSPRDTEIPQLDPRIFKQLQEQAEVQCSPKDAEGRPAYRLRSLIEGKGLYALPADNAGDIWFDMEGFHDPVLGTKLEYLFGACYRDSETKTPQFKAWWAHSPIEERAAFQAWVDWVEERRRQHPGLRIYHYADYEKSAMRRLSQQHATREREISEWLSKNVLVDLRPIVKHAIVLGEPNYSIKSVEHLYMGARQADVTNAGDSVVAYQRWVDSGEPASPGHAPDWSPQLLAIENYNQEDCESTAYLHDWLCDLRQQKGLPDHSIDSKATENNDPRELKPLEQLSERLLAQIPAEATERVGLSPLQLSWNAHELVAQLLPFHIRENNVAWWAFFDRREQALTNPGDLSDEGEAIASAQWVSTKAQESARTGADYHHFRFDPNQLLKFKWKPGGFPQKVELAETNLQLVIEDLNESVGSITLKDPWSSRDKRRGNGFDPPIPKKPTPLIKTPSLPSEAVLDSLEKQALAWLEGSQSLSPAMVQILERRAVPELEDVNRAINGNPNQVASELARFFGQHNGITVTLQGPPGTGKSTVTSQLIAELVEQGQRIAVSSNGNAAINSLLLKTKEALEGAGSDAQIVKAGSKEQELKDQGIACIAPKKLKGIERVVGGTAWKLCLPELASEFDLLVVDEAGQLSLANLLAMARCARSILLVGDQQQLAQPSKADHPGDAGQSCLDYLMGEDQAVVPKDQGVFLPVSWRMEPSLTAVVSELFYEGRLLANLGNCANCITWRTDCQRSDGQLYPEQGLVFEGVEHSGRSVHAPEEIDRIEQLVKALLGSPYCIARGNRTEEGVLDANNILVTAPYNVQVNRLQQRLHGKARVGTVDSFQGQEAPLAIHSLTASSGDDAPRGVGFLLEPNRLNVAISRAQCLSIVVGSPGLASGIANTVAEAEKINRLCQLQASR